MPVPNTGTQPDQRRDDAAPVAVHKSASAAGDEAQAVLNRCTVEIRSVWRVGKVLCLQAHAVALAVGCAEGVAQASTSRKLPE